MSRLKELYFGLRPVTVTRNRAEGTITTTPKSVIYGTALAAVIAVIKLVVSSNPWAWIIGLVTDGYAMVLLSPLILTYWALVSVVCVPVIAVLFVVFSVVSLWTVVAEYPASVINRDDISFGSPTSDSDWNTMFAVTPVVLLIVGFMVMFAIGVVLADGSAV